jgi:hypothetical protein
MNLHRNLVLLIKIYLSKLRFIKLEGNAQNGFNLILFDMKGFETTIGI